MKDFIKGALFVALVLPLIDLITALCGQIIKYICTIIATKEAKIAPPEEEPMQTFAMGFQAPEDDIEEEQEDW